MDLVFTHIRLLVDDFPACFRFYRDVLGFNVDYGEEMDRYADFNASAITIALFDRKAMSNAVGAGGLPFSPPAQDRAALIFSVVSVDETAAELVHKGVSIIAGPEDHPDWGIRTAHFRDPDGNLIEINQSLGT